MRKFIVIALTLVVMCTTLFVSSPSNAQDVRPCVSSREFNGMKIGTPIAEVNERWEFNGFQDPTFSNVLDYKRCGTPWTDRYYGVMVKNDRVQHLLVITPHY